MLTTALTMIDPARDACEQQAHDNIWLDWLIAPSCTPSVASKVGEAIWGSQFQPVIDDMKNGVADTTKVAATFWIKVPDPDVGNMTTGAPSDTLAFLQSSLMPFVGIIMIIAMIVGFARLMYTQGGGEFREIVGMLFRYIAFNGLLVIMVSSSLYVVHEFAQWILEQSTLGTNFAENLFALFNNDVGVTSAIILAGVLVVGAIFALIQAGLMIFRGVIIIVRTATLMLSVARSNSPAGKEATNAEMASLIAWVVYPGAAAIIYATAFRLMGTNPDLAGNGLLQCVYGIAAMIMAIFALPATLRMVSPAVGAAAGGKGLGGAIAGAATTYIVMKSGRGALAGA